MSKKRDLPAGIYPHHRKFRAYIPGNPSIYVGNFDTVEIAVEMQEQARLIHNKPKQRRGRPNVKK